MGEIVGVKTRVSGNSNIDVIDAWICCFEGGITMSTRASASDIFNMSKEVGGKTSISGSTQIDGAITMINVTPAFDAFDWSKAVGVKTHTAGNTNIDGGAVAISGQFKEKHEKDPTWNLPYLPARGLATLNQND